MVSLAESSVASVPLQDLQELQDHLLQHHRQSADSQATGQHPNNDESHPQDSIPNRDHDGEVPESDDVDQLLDQSVRSQPPRLTPSRSAPADIDAMAQQTPSQNAFTTMTRAVSFHGYAGGDTQPMDSQVYRDFTESMAKPSTTTPNKAAHTNDAWPEYGHENTYDTAVTDKSARTVGEGETGFVDLENAWQNGVSQAAQSTTSDLEDLLASQHSQRNVSDAYNANSLPKTPAVARHRKLQSGDLLSSAATDAAKRTPGFSQFGVASKVPNFSASQLFAQTQAPSSPMFDLTRSDPVMSRPSPNIRNNGQYSSPGLSTSSPMLMMHYPPASTAGEPRDTYTSMRESQERRAARLREELELQKRFGPGAIRTIDEDDEEEDSQLRRVEHKRIQRVMSDQALDEWSKYRAPHRPGSRIASNRKKVVDTIDLVTPAHIRKGNRVEFDISDDEVEKQGAGEDDENMEVDLPVEHEDTHGDGEGVEEEHVEEVDDENDVYDEFGQTVLKSQRDPEDMDETGSVAGDHGLDIGSETGSTDRAADRDTAMDQEKEEQPAHEDPEQGENVVTGTQPAVADSQPEGHQTRTAPAKETDGEPPTSSFVPGSQYPNAASKQRLRQPSRVPNSSNVERQSANQGNDATVPSSPPFQADVNTIPEDSAEPSIARQGMLAQFEARPAPNKAAGPQEPEVPESDGPRLDMGHTTEPSGFTTAPDSNTVFSTARTHHSESANSPKKSQLSRALSKASASQQSAPSPLKAAGVRRFAEMTSEPSQHDENAESSLNVDDIMQGVITMDDQNFIDVLSSPPAEKPAKRRRLMQSRSSRRPARKTSTAPAEVPASDDQPTGSSPPQPPAADEPAEEPPFVATVPAVQALQNSPSKDNKIPSATPEEPKAPDTPESVRRREELGRNAVSQLLSARSASAEQPSKLSGTGRKTAANRERDAAPARKNLRAKGRKGKRVADVAVEAPQPRLVQVNSQLDGVDEDSGAAVDSSTTPSNSELPAVFAPNRIFALFRGTSYNAYYPATWLSAGVDGKSHKVRFDDTTVTYIDAKDVRALDLRIGDIVKVDFEGFRSKTWIVKEFGRLPQDEDDRANGVDVYDHVTLKVQAKMAQRASLPSTGLAVQGEGEVFEVLVTNIKLTYTMLPHFADRIFTPPGAAGGRFHRPATPSGGVQTPEMETPASRSRRSVLPSARASAVTSRLREGSITSCSDRTTIGMFEDMAFAISYLSNESEKAEVTRRIRRHGGLILDQGFDELFVSPQLDEPSTPSKRSSKAAGSRPTSASGLGTGTLRLKPERQNLGFVALIADKHSRRAKYMQALSLGIPTLSGRWVLDSLDAARNSSLSAQDGPEPRAWTRYLLPAGESAYLGGAVRSRVLPIYAPAEALLATTVATRELMLKGEGVLLVAPKKGKGTWERRKAYAFLTLALGAGSVKKVADLEEARGLLELEGGKWGWVYVDEDVGEAAGVLFGKKRDGRGGRVGKKRKRGSEVGGDKEMCVAGMEGKVRVVGDEFVVQSLILGALVA